MKIAIKQIGMTKEHEGEVILMQSGAMPADCVVVFMAKEVWDELSQENEVELQRY